MRIDRTRKVAATVAAAAATGLLAVGVIVPAIAQEDASGAGPTDEPSEATADWRTDRRAEIHAAFAEALADELGLDTDTVAQALDTVRERLRTEHLADRTTALQERLDAAVEAGDLTQEQADAILEGHESGVMPFGGGHHGDGSGRAHGPGHAPGHGGGGGHGGSFGGHGSMMWGGDGDPAA